MDNQAIFQHAAAVLDKGESVALVTVVSVTGSSPGRVGYKMLVFDGGQRTAGTVGGGLTEARMIEEARKMLGSPAGRLFRFDLAGTPDEEKGICGGTVELLVEVFDKASLLLFQDLSAAADDGRGAVLVSIVASDGLPRKLYLKHVEQVNAAGSGISQEIAAAIREAATSDRTMTKISVDGMEVFIEPLALQPTVVLFGAGHVSYDIARLAKSVHFRIVVCDDRAQYANRERFPDADEILVEDSLRVFDRIRIDDRSYLVIVTRGHQHDFVVLEQAIRTDARYIGMIGSRRKILTLFEKLREKGVPEALLERVYSPIGVSIGAVTAEEIALSIVCELVKIRRLGDGADIGHMTLSRRRGAT